jgi:Permuted papain-like amidase enzyme, YaeF/YiiX, C92 family
VRGDVPHRVALVWLLLGAGCTASAVPSVQEGDILFQVSRTPDSLVLQEATHSRFSHLGLVTFRDEKPYVLEAQTTVHATPLADWVGRGEDGHYVQKRLVDAHQVLDASSVVELRKEMRRFEGKPYDSTLEWSDARMYASEFVWKVYERALGIRLGEPQRLRDLDLSVPELQRKLAEHFGDHIPLDEPVVSPERILTSARLETVAER